MIEQLKAWDHELFLWLNSMGHPELDGIMLFLSAKLVWIPLYLGLIFMLYRHYGHQFWKPLLAVILAVALADQITSSFMKPFFERLRPCKDPQFEGLMTLVGKCGGKFGFASSHAANTFTLSVFFLGLTRIKWYYLLVVWSALVAYSRVHLGVHFPADILVGASIGATLGWTFAWACKKWALKD
jgi:undecaprenyl-diphosphatase